MIYIAGPLFSYHERRYLEQISHDLHFVGYKTFLPHRDAGDVGTDHSDDIFQSDIDALKRCDMVVALLSGQDVDSGTAVEIGYAYALGKPIYGITAGDNVRKRINNMVWGCCTAIFPSAPHLIHHLEKEGVDQK